MEDLVLPSGWKREEVIRKSGLSAGKTDIYYYGPDGKKYRSKPQIAKVLGEKHDLTAFDFRTGRTISSSNYVRRAKSKRPTGYDLTKGYRFDTNISLPVRQTASIFKQPVTVIRSHPDSLVKTDIELKNRRPDRTDSLPPKQLFWERSLTGLNCCDIDEETLQTIDLPDKIQGISVGWSTENILQSISAALHLNVQPVLGQSHPPGKFVKDPTVHVNTNQPAIQQLMIVDDDIIQQEFKVDSARRQLEELLKSIKENELNTAEQPDSDDSESESEDEEFVEMENKSSEVVNDDLPTTSDDVALADSLHGDSIGLVDKTQMKEIAAGTEEIDEPVYKKQREDNTSEDVSSFDTDPISESTEQLTQQPVGKQSAVDTLITHGNPDDQSQPANDEKIEEGENDEEVECEPKCLAETV